jgi:hypothetical protein
MNEVILLGKKERKIATSAVQEAMIVKFIYGYYSVAGGG